MYRLRLLRNYFLCFFLCGQNSHIHFDTTKKRIRKSLLYLPRIVYFSYVILTAFQCFEFMQDYSIKNIYIMYITVWIPNMCALSDSVVYPTEVKKILQSFNRSIDGIELVMNIPISIEHFMKVFRVKFFLIITLNAVGLLYRVFIRASLFGMSADILTAFGMLLMNIASLHALILIDLVGFLLWSMNEYLKMCANQPNISMKVDPKIIIRNLRNVKTVHFKLWEISRRINKRFGWFLVTYTLESNILIVGYVFGTFLYTQLYKMYYFNPIIIRKLLLHSI